MHNDETKKIDAKLIANLSRLSEIYRRWDNAMRHEKDEATRLCIGLLLMMHKEIE